MSELRENMDGCGYTSSPCTPYPVKDNIYQKKINGYKFYLIKKTASWSILKKDIFLLEGL